MEATPEFRATPAKLGWLGVILGAIASLGVWAGGEALASHVGCGDTITTDATLDGDLINCQNNRIVIGAHIPLAAKPLRETLRIPVGGTKWHRRTDPRQPDARRSR